MARLRYNGLTATLGAALAAGDTTITFAAALTSAAGAVPTISGGDTIALTILNSAGEVAEIVSLTAYTSGATTGTIARAQESTTATAHAAGDKVVHSPTVADFTTSSSGAAETFDTAMAAISGKVHRWKFDETSGATVADSVGTLNLTLSGTYTRNVAGVAGSAATTFGTSALAQSSGLGSIPVGGNPVTLIVVYKTTTEHQTQMMLSAWGASGTRTNIGLYMNNGSASSDVGAFNGSDALRIANVLPADANWHLAALTYSAQFLKSYFDGQIYGVKLAGTQNTTASGNFLVGQWPAGSSQFLGDIDEVAVFNRALGKRELDRLYRAIAG